MMDRMLITLTACIQADTISLLKETFTMIRDCVSTIMAMCTLRGDELRFDRSLLKPSEIRVRSQYGVY